MRKGRDKASPSFIRSSRVSPRYAGSMGSEGDEIERRGKEGDRMRDRSETSEGAHLVPVTHVASWSFT